MLETGRPKTGEGRQPPGQPEISFNDRLAAWGIAFAGFAAWLILWHLMLGSAQWYALALAGSALTAYTATFRLKHSLFNPALHVFSWLCAGLALFTSFSLGAFLPFGVADLISPALGRFGGYGALWVLGILFVTKALVSFKSSFLDLGLFCLAGAIRVAYSTVDQENFPVAPLNPEKWLSVLFIPVVLGSLALLAAVLLTVLEKARWTAPAFLRLTVASGIVALLPGLIFNQTPVFLAGLGLVVAGLVLAGFASWLSRNMGAGKLALYWVGSLGGVMLLGLGLAVAYVSTAEELEVVLLRNTLERYAQKSWWYVFGEDRFPEQRGLRVAGGTISGQVTDEQGKAVAGANVVVSDPSGLTFSAVSGADGRYTMPGVKTGHYLPMAARAGYLDAVATGSSFIRRWRMAATVREGATTSNIDFVMKARPDYKIVPGNTLKFEEFSEEFRDNPVPSPALRRWFSFENKGLSKRGLVYEPMPDRGPGPFPILLIVYPGPANGWEGVSIPLAAQGFVVIAYQPELFGPTPERGLNLRGDVDDMLQLYNYAKSGQFSQRGDPQRVVITGGSVSTVYTYLMLREIERSSPADKAALRGAIKYGGLADMYRYRYDWDRGALYIDPGIQDLEDMLVAFGRPDTRPEIYMLFSPLFHLEEGSLPPTLVVHTSKDTIVPVFQTELLAKKMVELKVEHKLLIYPDIEHYLDTSKRDPAQLDMLNQTIDFLKLVTR